MLNDIIIVLLPCSSLNYSRAGCHCVPSCSQETPPSLAGVTQPVGRLETQCKMWGQRNNFAVEFTIPGERPVPEPGPQRRQAAVAGPGVCPQLQALEAAQRREHRHAHPAQPVSLTWRLYRYICKRDDDKNIIG